MSRRSRCSGGISPSRSAASSGSISSTTSALRSMLSRLLSSRIWSCSGISSSRSASSSSSRAAASWLRLACGSALERGGQVGGGHLAQAGELLGERAGLEQLAALLPRHDVRAVGAQHPPLGDRERGHLPAVARQLPVGDGHVGDGPGGGAAAVEAARQHLAGPPGERVEVDGAAEQLRAFGRHLPDPAEGDEDLPAAQLDDQAERARRLLARDRPDDHVADPADGAAVAVEQRPPGEAGGEHLKSGAGPVALPGAPAVEVTRPLSAIPANLSPRG